MFFNHLVAKKNSSLPQYDSNKMHEYIFARNGAFIRAENEFLTACIQIQKGKEVKELQVVEEQFALNYRKIPLVHVQNMLTRMVNECTKHNVAIESLFYFRPLGSPGELSENAKWEYLFPEQIQTSGSVKPVRMDSDSPYVKTLVEVHSHHYMEASFSGQDDTEQQMFKVYAVVGNIFDKPSISVRVGIDGNFLNIPASRVFEMPDNLRDEYRKRRRY